MAAPVSLKAEAVSWNKKNIYIFIIQLKYSTLRPNGLFYVFNSHYSNYDWYFGQICFKLKDNK